MSSDEGENETHGPKVGIKLNQAQAEVIIKKYFPNLSVISIAHVNRGYNNRVYLVTTCDNREFVLRLGGRFWTRYKTENEVSAILYVSQHCKAVPVPKIYGYCTDSNKSGANAEYILMEKMEGVPLEELWNRLDLEKKKFICGQVAVLFSEIQAIKFPKIGSFQFDEEPTRREESEIVADKPEKILKISKGVDFDGGPFSTFREYIKSTCETEIKSLKHCDFMKESDGYNERLQRIEKFVDAFEKEETLPPGISNEALENVPFVFTHGDFEPRNILVDKDTLKITCLLDWEFAGSYPIDEDWFAGFAFADCDTCDWRVFGEERPALKHNRVFDPEMVNSLREHFLQQMRKNGVGVPDDIPGHMIRAELFYFRGFICPWWLNEKRDPIPDTHYNDRLNACQKVDSILEKYGF